MYGVQQGGGQNQAFFTYVIYGWPHTVTMAFRVEAEKIHSSLNIN